MEWVHSVARSWSRTWCQIRSAPVQTAAKLYLVLDFVNGGHLFFNLYRCAHALLSCVSTNSTAMVSPFVCRDLQLYLLQHVEVFVLVATEKA